MARSKGCFKTAVSNIVKWSLFCLPCIPKHDDNEDEVLPQTPKELSPETVDHLYAVLGSDLSDLLLHIRRLILHRTVNYETGFFTEPTGVIDGKSMTAWLMINMDISEMEEAQFISNLLNGHETLFKIINHHMTVARVGYFRRYVTPAKKNDGKSTSNDFLFACYLCERIGSEWKDLVFDLSQWVFVYVPPKEVLQRQIEDPRAVTPWVPSLWAGPLIFNKPHLQNIRDCLVMMKKMHSNDKTKRQKRVGQ